VAESGALLRWLADGNFTFLGYREYDLVPDRRAASACARYRGPGSASCATTGPGRRGAPLSPQVVARAQDPAERLVLAKANSRSTVYRANYLDYVSVKKLSPAGEVTGEFRFLGLYTHAAHNAPIAGVPVLRRKLAQVLAAAGLSRDSHDGKDLVEILQDYPREELFEISAAELTPIALGVLRLSERKQTRLFLRRDRYGRYMSCLLYLPRDRYTTKVRLRAQDILMEALHGVSADYSATVGDSALARLYVVVRGERGRPVPQVDAAALERRLAASVRSWDEDLAAEATRVLGEERARTLLDLCSAGIPETYKADVSPQDAVDDLTTMLDLRESRTEFAVRLVQKPERWTLVVYRSGTPITLSDVLPQLQHMGLEVVDEHPYQFTGPSGHGSFWIYEFGLRVRPPRPRPVSAAGLRGRADRAVARPDRRRRVQRAGPVRGPELARGQPAARLRQVPAPGRDPVQRGLRAAGAAVQRGHHPAAGPAVRVPVRPGQAERRGRALRGDHRGDPRPARRGGQPRRTTGSCGPTWR
jgi:glutamate dehydrogenase